METEGFWEWIKPWDVIAKYLKERVLIPQYWCWDLAGSIKHLGGVGCYHSLRVAIYIIFQMPSFKMTDTTRC